MRALGSEITLTCGQGFVIEGSATLQCMRLPGWSSYSPVWNSSVPSCRPLNTTDDNQGHRSTAKYRENTTNVIQTAEEMTAETDSDSGRLATQIIIVSTVGTILGFFSILLFIGCIVWCIHRRKKKRRRPADSNSSSANITSNSCAVHHSSTEHPDNRIGDASSGRKKVYQIYQNSAQDHNFEAEMTKDSADTNSWHLHDVIDQDSEYLAPYQNVTGNTGIEQYMDMSGSVTKNIKKDITLNPRWDTFAANEKDTDENGYLVSSVSQRRVAGIKPHARCGTTGTYVIDDALSDGPSPYGVPFIPSIPVGDSTRSSDLQSPVYEDIPSNIDRSAPTRETQHAPKYRIIGIKDKQATPLHKNPNVPLYSASIYPNKEREERGVDENGYLILETCAGGIVDERHVGKDKSVPTASFYKDKTSSEVVVSRHKTQNSHGKIKSVFYESIPYNLKL
ncbi:uncharacterized protein [Diadema antillarum]|uniref:uncharacterized protein n=1 Tax=Diadema antillarum TaxID=105358 RepID=UPI003A86AA64